jgi:hypothetical protein
LQEIISGMLNIPAGFLARRGLPLKNSEKTAAINKPTVKFS